MKHTIVAPSILSADFLRLGEAIHMVEERTSLTASRS